MGRRDEPGQCVRPPRGGAWCGVLAALAVGLVGCGSSGHGADAAVDVVEPPRWWQPKLGEAKNWDIQLSGAIDVSTPRVMYDLDLWSVVPSATMLDYGDGSPVVVPQGTRAGVIAQLHARTPPAIVICHIETGALEMGRPDAAKFPAAAIGGDVPVPPGFPPAKFLDVRQASRMNWAQLMWKRFDLAKQIGCDGIESAHNDVASFSSGFDIPTEDSYSWYDEVAKQGHDRELSTGMKNGDLLSGQIDRGAASFDWLMIERCGEHDRLGAGGCDVVRPFTDANKAVLAIDYNVTEPDDNGMTHPQTSDAVCMFQVTARIQDGLYKDVSLTKAVRTQCNP
ncbi:MAG: endo alpha-1,4 polygalactosaminidase [Deltaproteobacteria bacterium]|nr:MAG: endo alpha-1,4 polygalactosaminidase [Deltaproteobacteria bacterium]